MSERIRRTLAALILTALASGAHAAITLDDILMGADNRNNGVVIEGVRRGMDVDSTGEDGVSLLMRAARDGNLELVDFLLKNHANPRMRAPWGDTALAMAAFAGHAPVVQRLLDGGAPVESPGAWSPILYAAMNGHNEVVRTLLARGADPNSRAPSKLTPLMIAAKGGHIEVVRTLLGAKADASAVNDRGEGAMKWALDAQNTDIADLLRAAGAK